MQERMPSLSCSAQSPASHVEKKKQDSSLHLRLLVIVDADDLIDPTDEGGNLDVDSRDVRTTATEAPRDESRDLVEAVRLTHEWSSTITLSQWEGDR